MMIGNNGMVNLQNALVTGKPIFTRNTVDDEPTGRTSDHCTKQELDSLGIYLTEQEQEGLIVAFFKAPNYRGVKPLYSFEMVKHVRRLA